MKKIYTYQEVCRAATRERIDITALFDKVYVPGQSKPGWVKKEFKL